MGAEPEHAVRRRQQRILGGTAAALVLALVVAGLVLAPDLAWRPSAPTAEESLQTTAVEWGLPLAGNARIDHYWASETEAFGSHQTVYELSLGTGPSASSWNRRLFTLSTAQIRARLNDVRDGTPATILAGSGAPSGLLDSRAWRCRPPIHHSRPGVLVLCREEGRSRALVLESVAD